MRQEDNMKNRNRYLATLLTVSTIVSSITLPSSDVRAEQTGQETECEVIDPAVVEPELPETDSEYVVYMENSQPKEVSFADDTYELSSDNSAEIVLETDLSEKQLEQLEELNGQEEIYVEENIFLTGASQAAEEEDTDNWDDLGLSEKIALKKMMREQAAKQEETAEPEWNMQMIHADDTDMDAETAGEPVKVAVLDSGVEFISGIPVEKSINLVKDEQDLTYYMNDMTGHGTAVAGIIHQIAPAAQIYSVRVLNCENRGRLSDIVAGIYWCIEQDVDIINMSFGTNVESEVLRKAIQAATQKGILMVSSAGNGGDEGTVEYPAAYPEVIAVGAVGTDAQKTEESTTGEEVELAAPGEQILTKSMLGLETVNSGTSMAAPHAAGAAALLMLKSDCRDADYIRALLAQSSNPLGDEESYGYGLIDLSYAEDLMNSPEEVIINAVENENEDEKDNSSNVQEDLELSERPIETFEDVDYVEGRWGVPNKLSGIEQETHEDLAGIYYNAGNGFTANEIKIFKAGAVYPDNHISGLNRGSKNPGWHGWNGEKVGKKENYIANFIFATRIAKAGGKTSDLQPVKGQSAATFELMKMNISTSCTRGIQTEDNIILEKKQTWAQIFTPLGLNYAGQNESKQKKWRTLFLYGMALHTATDALAHNSFHKVNGRMISYVEEKIDDNPLTNPYAWSCAQVTARNIGIDCDLRIEGLVTDFSSLGNPYWGNGVFYLGNIIKYAEAVNGKSSVWITQEFKPVNYSF